MQAVRRSSSPLRGAATWPDGRLCASARYVIIAPTRGSNLLSRCRHDRQRDTGHHRPYEGQQLRRLRGERPRGLLVIIAPTRGSNAGASPTATGPSGVIIAPTRGSNVDEQIGGLGATVVIIAPTRGSNSRMPPTWFVYAGGHHRPYEGQQRELERAGVGVERGHHRPYEGQQPMQNRPDSRSATRHHRPYEGQQQRRTDLAQDRPRPVIIAPTRGSNTLCSSSGLVPTALSSSPLRGAATSARGRCLLERQGSSSPLRGAAT